MTFVTKLPDMSAPYMKPLSWELFQELLEQVYRPRPPPSPPRNTIDFDLIKKHKIVCGYDAHADMRLFSAEDMKRARACGAVKDL